MIDISCNSIFIFTHIFIKACCAYHISDTMGENHKWKTFKHYYIVHCLTPYRDFVVNFVVGLVWCLSDTSSFIDINKLPLIDIYI